MYPAAAAERFVNPCPQSQSIDSSLSLSDLLIQ